MNRIINMVLNVYYSSNLHYTPGEIYFYYSHFMDEGNKTQGSFATCPCWKNGIQTAWFNPRPLPPEVGFWGDSWQAGFLSTVLNIFFQRDILPDNHLAFTVTVLLYSPEGITGIPLGILQTVRGYFKTLAVYWRHPSNN